MSKKSVFSLTLSLFIGFLGGYYLADHNSPPAASLTSGGDAPELATTEPASTTHVCPMHPAIVSAEPGACPICGMDLVETDTPAVLASPVTANTYVCPMHPEITDDHASSCPICGMDLVASKAPTAAEHHHEGHPEVRISPTVVHNLGIRTATIKRADLKRSIETIGKITRVESNARRILTPPIQGELTYLAEKYQGDLVGERELLFSVSSPELLELERQYRDATQAKDRRRASTLVPKLRDMGLTPEQLALLYGGHEPTLAVEVHAQQDSFVFDRRGKVGAAVHTGYTVFNLAGKQRVIEITAEIFEREWSWVKVGQDAEMTVRGLPGIRFSGKVVRVEPPVGYTTRSLEVALKFRTDNPVLSQSMFAHVSIAGQPLHNVLVAPLDTVIRTGSDERVVLVRGPGNYQPVSVVAGEEAGGMIQIRSGLKEGDKVVASGQFLIDSESNLRAGFRRMSTPGTDTGADTEIGNAGEADHGAEHNRHD